jgi:TorA maturation chaperone TorD
MSDRELGEQLEIAGVLALANVCEFLASVLRLPTLEAVKATEMPTFSDDLVKLLADAKPCLRLDLDVKTALSAYLHVSVESEQRLDDLRYAYTRLFSHPEKPLIPPYESQFLYWEKHPDGTIADAPRMFVCPAAIDAERIYASVGLSRARKLNEPGDFIATEVEFVAKLFEHKSQLLRAEDYEASNRIDEVFWEFADSHIKKWWYRFFFRLKESRVHPFYDVIGTIGCAAAEAFLGAFGNREESAK